ncbi:MAG: hypothetical protein R3B74_16265 [Nitrospirales bacterium]|nr:hypothetical protein [Nitrospirales bacterium]
MLKTSPVSGPDVSVSTSAEPVVRSRAGHRRFRHWLDQAGGVVVWVGGIATIVSILGIFLYLLWEVLPLFHAADGRQDASLILEHDGDFSSGTTLVGMDEYQEVVFVLEESQVKFFQMPQGNPLPEVGGLLEIPGTVQSSVLVGQKGNFLSVGTGEGFVYPVEVQFRPVFEGSIRTMVPTVKVHQSMRVIPEGKKLLLHAHTKKDERQSIAALTADGMLWLTSVKEPGEFSFSDELNVSQQQLPIPEGMIVTRLVLDRFGKRLVCGNPKRRIGGVEFTG